MQLKLQLPFDKSPDVHKGFVSWLWLIGCFIVMTFATALGLVGMYMLMKIADSVGYHGVGFIPLAIILLLVERFAVRLLGSWSWFNREGKWAWSIDLTFGRFGRRRG